MSQPFNPDDHNPETNPEWRPNVAERIYACAKCGHEQQTGTNHTGTVWGLRCRGRCRTITNPHTAREVVMPYYGPHTYVREVYPLPVSEETPFCDCPDGDGAEHVPACHLYEEATRV